MKVIERNEFSIPKSYLIQYGLCPNCKEEIAVIIKEMDDGYEIFCDKCGGPLWIKK